MSISLIINRISTSFQLPPSWRLPSSSFYPISLSPLACFLPHFFLLYTRSSLLDSFLRRIFSSLLTSICPSFHLSLVVTLIISLHSNHHFFHSLNTHSFFLLSFVLYSHILLFSCSHISVYFSSNLPLVSSYFHAFLHFLSGFSPSFFLLISSLPSYDFTSSIRPWGT